MTKERLLELKRIVENRVAEEAETHAQMLERRMPTVVIDKHRNDVAVWEDISIIISEAIDNMNKDEPAMIHHDKDGNEYWNFGNAVEKGIWEIVEEQRLKNAVEAAPDMVNQPAHYNMGKYEVIDVIKDWLTPEEFRGYTKGNLIKYVARERLKNGDEDMEKAEFYLHYFNTDGEKGVK